MSFIGKKDFFFDKPLMRFFNNLNPKNDSEISETTEKAETTPSPVKDEPAPYQEGVLLHEIPNYLLSDGVQIHTHRIPVELDIIPEVIDRGFPNLHLRDKSDEINEPAVMPEPEQMRDVNPFNEQEVNTDTSSTTVPEVKTDTNSASEPEAKTDANPEPAPEPAPEPKVTETETSTKKAMDGLFDVYQTEHSKTTEYPDKTIVEVWTTNEGRYDKNYHSETYTRTETYKDDNGNMVTVVHTENSTTQEETTYNFDKNSLSQNPLNMADAYTKSSSVITRETNVTVTTVKDANDKLISKTEENSDGSKKTQYYDKEEHVTKSVEISDNKTIESEYTYKNGEEVTVTVKTTTDGHEIVTFFDMEKMVGTQTENGITKEITIHEKDDCVFAEVKYTDENGNSVKQKYSDVEFDGSVIISSYDIPISEVVKNPNGDKIEETNVINDNTSVTKYYDSNGDVYSETTTTYTEFGRDDYTTHNIFYDTQGNEKNSYDTHITQNNGLVTTETVENGNVTVVTVTDDKGELVSQTMYIYDNPEKPNEATGEVVYNSSGEVISQKNYNDTSINNDSQNINENADQNVVSEEQTDAAANNNQNISETHTETKTDEHGSDYSETTTVTKDADGNIVSSTTVTENSNITETTTTTYNQDGSYDVHKETYVNNNLSSSSDATYTVDSNGNITGYTTIYKDGNGNPDGHDVTTRTYNSDGTYSEETNEYNSEGNQTGTSVTEYDSDGEGHVIFEQSVEGGTTSHYLYDEDGDQSAKINSVNNEDGTVTTTIYEDGDITSVTVTDKDGNLVSETTYNYDQNGELINKDTWTANQDKVNNENNDKSFDESLKDATKDTEWLNYTTQNESTNEESTNYNNNNDEKFTDNQDPGDSPYDREDPDEYDESWNGYSSEGFEGNDETEDSFEVVNENSETHYPWEDYDDNSSSNNNDIIDGGELEGVEIVGNGNNEVGWYDDDGNFYSGTHNDYQSWLEQNSGNNDTGISIDDYTFTASQINEMSNNDYDDYGYSDYNGAYDTYGDDDYGYGYDYSSDYDDYGYGDYNGGYDTYGDDDYGYGYDYSSDYNDYGYGNDYDFGYDNYGNNDDYWNNPEDNGYNDYWDFYDDYDDDSWYDFYNYGS